MGTLSYDRALVTGASSGIGEAVCRALALEDLNVMAVARWADRLAKLADETGSRTLVADVLDVRSLSSAVAEFRPDIVVNNAGTAHGISGLADVFADDIDEAISINVVAPIQITAAAIKIMKIDGRRGHIVNIGSISGLHALVSAVYGASKGAMHIFGQNLRFELRGTPIRVTEICPGRTSSELYEAAKGDAAALAAMKSTDIRELQPQDIAASVLFALKAPPHVNISTIEILPTEQAVGGATMTPLDRQRE